MKFVQNLAIPLCQFTLLLLQVPEGNVRPFDLAEIILESKGIESKDAFVDITREGLYAFRDVACVCPGRRVYSLKQRHSPHWDLFEE